VHKGRPAVPREEGTPRMCGSRGGTSSDTAGRGSILPGEHRLDVTVELEGYGYGVFSYLTGYDFTLRSRTTFAAPESGTVNLDVIGHERGGVTTPLPERPAVHYVLRAHDAGGPTD
jgi:hypothetical protein